ncbi:MAG TPA: GNAT family protein [Mycobacteriales bacterium]|nr:GNAT family protein [Mycobacteriales bacterium]
MSTRLRPARPDEVAVLAEWSGAPSSPFEDWTGEPPPGLAGASRTPAPDGGGDLAVTDGDDVLLGSVSWHPVLYGPNPGSSAFDIGISLQPPARGRGHGARAQRLLAEYLFATTPVHRVQASTDVQNVAEQRALERAGFRAEGVLRGAQWRHGAYHDLVSYARLRTDD